MTAGGRRAGLFCTVVTLLQASGLDAQTVRGTVTLTDGGAPADGAFVRLLDASGRQRAGVLTDAFGRYALRAPETGSYRLRVEFIGRRTTETGPVELVEDDVFEWSPSLAPLPVSIRGIDVAVAPRCRVRPEEGTAAAALWDEARKALEIALWAEEQDLFRYELLGHRRELDPERDRIVAEETERWEGYFRRPFAGRPAADLVRGGFVQETPEGRFAYAPDAPMLLADAFLDSHCFRPRRGDDPARIGLAFEPTRDRRTTDIRGVMWMYAETGELESVAYRYVRFPEADAALDLGGRVEFERLPSGAWIVRRWSLEMPVLGDVRRPGTVDVWDRRTVGIMEEGGEVLKVLDREGRAVLAADRATLAGTVFDSVRARPLADAEVRLAGTDRLGRTGPDGRFLLTGLSGGPYTVVLSHPRLDSLGIRPDPAPVDLVVGEAASLTLAVPATIAAEEDLDLRVEGELLDASGRAPFVGALASLVDPSGTVHGSDMSDDRGRYRLEAPGPGRYRVKVEVVGRETVRSEPFAMAEGRRRFHSLVFDGPRVELATAADSAPGACVVGPREDSAVGRAREEVRKALGSLIWAQDAERFEYRLVLHERELAAGDTAEVGEVEDTILARTEPVEGFVSHTFGEVPRTADGRPRFVESLVLDGDSGMVVATPGPRFLASALFGERYCLDLVSAPGGPNTLGLVFEPGSTVDTTRTEVRGLLVLDRTTGALRSLHYRYVRFPGPPAPRVPGGWMTFARLPGGPFFVRDWESRLPRLGNVRDVVAREPPYVYLARASEVVRGGRVVAARRPGGDVLWSRDADAPDDSLSGRMWATGALLDEGEGGDVLAGGPGTVSARRVARRAGAAPIPGG